MNIAALKVELDAGHPDTGAYDADAATAAVAINLANRTHNKDSMTGDEILNAVDATEWAARDATEKQTVWDVVHLGTVDPFGVAATLIIAAFGGSGDTITALAALRKNPDRSRAAELGLGIVYQAHVTQARAYHG
jgi:hypothetical protein